MEENQNNPLKKKKITKVDKIREELKGFPGLPGVYLMKNNESKILYIGKAKNLKNRVRSYFNGDQTAKTSLLVKQIHDIDYIVTKTEVEAFLLEASLIKKHRPKYNIRLKDDKSYPYIRISMADNFPRLYLCRKVIKDGSFYFGPYTNGFVVRETIRFLNEAFNIRDCQDGFMSTRKRPCMTFEIGRCKAPCVALVSDKEYRKEIAGALKFLRGENKEVVEHLERLMKSASKDERFEQAAKYRNSLQALRAILEKQRVINAADEQNQDAISFHGDERGVLVATVHVRHGLVIGQRSHFLPQVNIFSEKEDVREWLVDFVNQYYYDNVIPDEVLLPVDLGRDLTELLQNVLYERSGQEVSVRFATDELGRGLMELAESNAKQHFNSYVTREENKLKALEYVQKKLHLPKIPRRIECYDISNFQGKESVGSQVTFVDGVPFKDGYRRYKIKTVEGADDYGSLKEVLLRRFKHTEWEDPDLVLIDGGKGQLSKVMQALKEIKREDIAVVGIAKARVTGEFSDKEVGETEERFFLPGQVNPITFNRNEDALHILTNLRDEAHRFAITYHRKLREDSSLKSVLDEVPGLGDKRKKELLIHFGSIDEITKAPIKEISDLPGFGETFAQKLISELSRIRGGN
ncbi:MAG: excinuclease ABC subunit C [Proteobacteria bacterium SG_bin7]|nr:MAG: excinuclease ABC subunit C [Proteobacteria bacterium SG_bin7]